ncbi:MAG: 16S rRNA (guanine(966)-N(2))-methyltransferase RsmD [Bacillota bacterium]|nr:16S rRNA (guanine(966)-N(2))-methyltransferase RsmD [Bacillota bacterium]MDW7730462.1 16S rRNA (guanine(966)-N(2))-methyltransferase RsmD [Bacillota bacterium]
MRVIAGYARGTRLKAPKGTLVRPTADKVKEALFSILGSRVIGAVFLDLYAGSGAVGIEALSRGAEKVIFVEKQRNGITLIRENLQLTKLSERAHIINADVTKAILLLAREEFKADLVFLDPPYNISDPGDIINRLIKSDILTGRGLIVVEHAYKNKLWSVAFENVRQRKYGDTCLTFISNTG